MEFSVVDTVHIVTLSADPDALTWIHAPVFSLHKLQMRDQRLGGMWETLVMGSILSGQAMLTCSREHKQHESLPNTCCVTSEAEGVSSLRLPLVSTEHS